MSDVPRIAAPTINQYTPHALDRSRGAAAGHAANHGEDRAASLRPSSIDAEAHDSLELSAEAYEMSLLHLALHDPPARGELIERIRAEIEAGVYESPEKINAAAEALTGDLLDAYA